MHIQWSINEFGELNIPQTEKIIKKEYINSNKNIITVSIPESIETIEEFSFEGCENLRSVIFNKDCKCREIKNGTFKDCKKLAFINNWPKNITHIEDHAFLNCEKLKSLPEFPKSFRRFEVNSFAGCVFDNISFSENNFDMEDIPSISLECKIIKVMDRIYEMSDWHKDFVFVVSRHKTDNFVVEKGLSSSSIFNNNKSYMYYYKDYRSGLFDIGNTIREAKEIVDKKSNYNLEERIIKEKWTIDTEIDYCDFAIASKGCFSGVRDFMEINNYDINKKYKISEILKMSEGTIRYKNFKNFLINHNIIR